MQPQNNTSNYTKEDRVAVFNTLRADPSFGYVVDMDNVDDFMNIFFAEYHTIGKVEKDEQDEKKKERKVHQPQTYGRTCKDVHKQKEPKSTREPWRSREMMRPRRSLAQKPSYSKVSRTYSCGPSWHQNLNAPCVPIATAHGKSSREPLSINGNRGHWRPITNQKNYPY
jgi:hypothetical protein